MDERQKYLLILIIVVITMITSLITVFAVLVKSIQRVDNEMRDKPTIKITTQDSIITINNH